MNQNQALVVFEGQNIRRVWHNDQWYFSVIDVIAALTDSANSRNYWNMMKVREKEASNVELYTFCVQLKLVAEDEKFRETDCASTESLFRIIQSIPSKKAEPFKRWLARVGYERIQEIENPELAQNRAKEYYQLKGYPKEWIEKRIRGIAIRQELTDEWKARGITENREFAILTNEISQATFGVPIKIHKQIKNLDPRFKNQNLRDHMTDLELIFSMLGEKLTTETTRKKDTQGFADNLDTAKEGGTVAGRARQDAEKTLGIRVVSSENSFGLTTKKSIGQKNLKKREI